MKGVTPRRAVGRMLRAVPHRARSLRVRLVVGVVVLAAIGLAITGSVGTALLRSYLVDQLDDQLTIGLRQIGPTIATGTLPQHGRRPPGQITPPRRFPGSRAEQLPTPFLFSIVSAAGRVTEQVGGLRASSGARPDFTEVTAAKVAAEHGRPFTIPAVGGGSGFRVRAIALDDGSDGAVAVAVSLRSVDATVHRLTIITWLVALGVIIALVVLGNLAVRLGLRPLRRVEQAAEDIAAGDMSHRVPAGPPGTEVGRLAGTLNTMLGQIEAAFAARTRSEETLRQFAADASHELRTPLTTIRGYAELLQKGALADAAAQQQAVGRIEAEATRMGGLVDDLLLLAHLDQRRPLHVTRVDLAALAAEVVADARVRDPQRPITLLRPDAPVEIAVDADRFRQVIGNLVGNALVHTPPDTPVTVTVESIGAPRPVVRLTVADAGPGLATEQLGHIFERFYRVDAGRSRAAGGSGLGLAIVAAVVAASGGTVTAGAAPEGGTRFTVELTPAS